MTDAREMQERCAQWHEDRAREWRNCESEHKPNKTTLEVERIRAELHELSAAAIRALPCPAVAPASQPPNLGLETTAEERTKWLAALNTGVSGYPFSGDILCLIRDHDRLAAEVARLTTALGEAQADLYVARSRTVASALTDAVRSVLEPFAKMAGELSNRPIGMGLSETELTSLRNYCGAAANLLTNSVVASAPAPEEVEAACEALEDTGLALNNEARRKIAALLRRLAPSPAGWPTAWMRGVRTPSSPHGPEEWDAEFVYGDDPPEGEGWLPLYRKPPPSPAEGWRPIAEKRVANIKAWLDENAPYIDKEQKHLDAGSTQRAYWHYGYLIALRDILALPAPPLPGTEKNR
jgi:hypothetical protein